MKTLVFCLEEPSAKAMLERIVFRVMPSYWQVRYVIFQGKQHLEKNIVRKLKSWCLPDSVFIIVRDQDSGDCKAIKSKLARLCEESGKTSVLIRIACRELESFYLGDLAAVEQGLNLSGIKKLQQKKKYRNPDNLGSPSKELSVLTGYAYEKMSGSRAIAPFMALDHNCSKSFQALLAGIQKMVAS
ncbi:DUF4276 family protein [Solidesulfovibrio carbinolicus]|uniref:DUF4276 domain-containing protein n=1 Tax=Solidesulfovibrio carbinolicus TaxID=296842 RepID=A0A4P6HLZ6_9BACT|nr:DUF4276 family protein [Solidesulfovibrio carbinolicus]QAZ68191.1 hypothetical protein C3Y92_13545 [Solidesulfovibrio carbinolicus]HML53515.1 DUF4276 family protein [Solidesulfovibrio magneticus]